MTVRCVLYLKITQKWKMNQIDIGVIDCYQVTVRIGTPVTGYGQESRNRAARQRIPNRVWTDEYGVEHVEVYSLGVRLWYYA